MTSFEYPAIGREGTTFRLLRLLKGDDNRIHCELFGSELPKDVGDYAALSYTWGSERKLCEIIINEREMRVTKNAYLALRDLRYPDKDRILWIDALCIYSFQRRDSYRRSWSICRQKRRGFLQLFVRSRRIFVPFTSRASRDILVSVPYGCI
jgi:hypothetical protein